MVINWTGTVWFFFFFSFLDKTMYHLWVLLYWRYTWRMNTAFTLILCLALLIDSDILFGLKRQVFLLLKYSLILCESQFEIHQCTKNKPFELAPKTFIILSPAFSIFCANDIFSNSHLLCQIFFARTLQKRVFQRTISWTTD